MKKLFNPLFILLVIFTQYHSVLGQQIVEENNIFNSIILHQIKSGSSQLYLDCKKAETYFDLESFLEETTLVSIPRKILDEILFNSKNDIKNKDWDCDLLKKLKLNKDFLVQKKCLKEKEIKRVLKIKSKNIILRVHKPIFDKNNNHCVIDLTILTSEGVFKASSFFLKKIYGKWIILEEFNFSMS